MDDQDVSASTPSRAVLAPVLQYLLAIDRGCARSAIACFTADAVFQVREHEHVGRDAIAQFLADREAQSDRHTVHVLTNERIQEIDDDEVAIDALILLHVRQPDGGYCLERVLDSRHVVRRSAAGWQVHHRSSSTLHASTGPEPGLPAVPATL